MSGSGDLHLEEVGVDDVDGVANGTPDVEFDGGHGCHWQVLPLSEVHHRVVIPVPLPIYTTHTQTHRHTHTHQTLVPTHSM